MDVQAYYRSSEADYNALSHAAFNLWTDTNGPQGSGLTITKGQKKSLIDVNVEDAWFNEFVSRDGEVITFLPNMTDRLVIFSFTADIVPQGGASDPFVQYIFQLRRTDNTLIATSPIAFIAATGSIQSRQVDLTAYIRGDDDPLVMYGATPEIVNTGDSPVTFKNATMRVFTVDSRKKPFLDYGSF